MKKFVLILAALIPVIALAGPQITIPEKHWDYGFVPQNAVLTHTYLIKNIGDDTLRITEVKPGCSCTAAPIQKQILPPGDSTSVELIFNPKHSRGTATKNAQINSNDPVNGSERIDFTCIIYADSGYFRPVKVNPSKLEFSSKNPRFNVVIQNDTGSALELKLVETLPPDLRLKIKNNVISVGKKGEITLEWKGMEPEYDIERVLTFDTNTELVPRFTIPYSIKGLKGPKIPEKPLHAEEKQATAQPATTKIGQAIPSLGVPINKSVVKDTSSNKANTSGQ
jgi:hypothetical protein